MLTERPLLAHLPKLASKLAFAEVGQFPSRVQPLAELIAPDTTRTLENAYVKRDDLNSSVYGGNKVRTLEVFFGEALRRGQSQMYATGAYGSNHAVASALHAPLLGLRAGALLFPQPPSQVALDNLQVTSSRADPVLYLSHWSVLPFAVWKLRRDFPQALVMPPGGATPLGALGYVSAVLELAEQIQRNELPSPQRIVVGMGSTCTTAGLLVGIRLARALGLAFEGSLPQVVAIRVTPWPVTSALRVALLAKRCSELLAGLCGEPKWQMQFTDLIAGLRVDGRFIGEGYGHATASGRAAMDRFRASDCMLDSTYSAKSAAGLFASLSEHPVPTLFWATKSSVPLPVVPNISTTSSLPEHVLVWTKRAAAAST